MRDLRDPQKLGEQLFRCRPEGSKLTLSQAYDLYNFASNIIPDYPQDESMATMTAREYRAELEAAAAAGDKYAASRLEAL